MKKLAFMVAGITSGAGKTTVTQGILSLLVRKGMNVRSFKLGPDYIDSAYHSRITENPCITLDKFLLTPTSKTVDSIQILRETFYSYAADADALVVEGVGGLFDDWYSDGNSPAQIAIDLDIPIILVADGFSFCQTLGIMLNPLFEHNAKLNIFGVLLNKISSQKHFDKILETISPQHREKVIGYIPGDKELFIDERHLGLITESETDNILSKIDYLAEMFSKIIPMDFLYKLKVKVPSNYQYGFNTVNPVCNCKIAVARDKAFSFYYQYNLDNLENLGAKLIYFSPISDRKLPEDIDAIYLGGGFPEVFASSLASNIKLIEQIRLSTDKGMPIYAECGGLIYLCKDIIEFKTNKKLKAVGIFPLETIMNSRLTIGYATGELKTNCLIGNKYDKIKGHLFHKSEVLEREETNKVCELISLDGIRILEGYSYKNVYASYLHIHFRSCPNVAQQIIRKATEYRLFKY